MAQKWTDILASVAPTIATALGGPLAGLATRALSTAILGKPAANPKELSEAILGADHETLLALKQADHTFNTRMKELEIDLEKIHSGDRDSARNREIATGDNATKILAVVVVCGFFATLASIAFVEVPVASQQPINILLGALTAMLIQVGNYYFGSSAGSKQKTKLLGDKL